MAQALANPSPNHDLLSVAVDNVGALQAAYMPFVTNGGLFIPTTKRFALGEQVFLLLRLIGEAESIPLAATVVWITPESATSARMAGIGVQFSAGDEGVRRRIEERLGDGAAASADAASYTM